MTKRFVLILVLGLTVSSVLRAEETSRLEVKEFKLVSFATRKFAKDPVNASKKIPQGMLVASAGQTDLTLMTDTGAADVLAKLGMEVSLSESAKPDVYEIRHQFSIFFPAGRWPAEGKGEFADTERLFAFEKDKPQELEKIRSDAALIDQLADDLTGKGVELFRKYGYANLTPSFQEQFAAKIKQFVWSIHQQLPQIILKLAEKYPEVKNQAGKKTPAKV